jgi:signal transduction histidine kinase
MPNERLGGCPRTDDRARRLVASERPSVVVCLSRRMNLSLRSRLAAMALMIIVLAAVIVGAAAITLRQVRSLRRRFSGVRIESFRIADYLQASVLELNATLLRFVLGRDPSDWQKFSLKSEKLALWLGQQRPSTPREREELTRIRSDLEAYRTEAQTIAARNDIRRGDVSAIPSQIEKASQKLLRLGYGLASAHRAAAAQLVDASQKSLTLLQQVTFTALVLLMVVSAWAITIVYREMIAPLRLKLVESRATIERQEKLASLGVLAAGVAHEIRNPLTAIKARLFTLRKAVGETSTALEDAQVIEREINRLERIVRDVLLFARPAEPKYQTISAMALVREVGDLMRSQLEKANITFTIKNPVDAKIRGDPDQLKQVLLNLIRNAAESIGEHGEITLCLRTESASLGRRPIDAAILEVEDSGRGISTEVQKRLFDPFFTTKPAGTGLGLSIAARIVEQHGGTLHYKTEVGRGTTFGIVLPLNSSDEK